MGNRSSRGGRALLFLVPFLLLVVYLLWPLSTRRWSIPPSGEVDSRKDEYAQRTAFRAMARGGPRVILIVADDLSQMDTSRYGGAHAPVGTPAIDGIGAAGATFTDANATATICAPSRAAILTGRYQQRYGFEVQPHDRYARNRLEYAIFRRLIDTDHMRPIGPQPIPRRKDIARQGLPADQVTLAELLRARGYRTVVYGKWHLGYGEEFSPLRRGFEEHYGFYEAFSLYAPIDAPNIVNTPIDDFSDKHMWSRGRRGASAIVHNDEVVDEEAYLTTRFAQLAADYIREHAEEPFFLYLPFNAPHTPLQAPRERFEALSHIEDPIRRTYAAMISELDDAVATVLDAVDESGIYDETIVIFTSDNGGTSYLGVTDNGPLAGGKFTNYQGGMAVPLLLRYPGVVPSGVVYDEPVSLLDIFATVESLTEEENSAAAVAMDGVNLVPHLTGEREGSPHEALYYRSFYNKSVRSGEWKLIVTTDGSPAVAEGETRYELYNLRHDPWERFDVAGRHPTIVAELEQLLDTWEQDMAPPKWPPVMHFWHDIWGRRKWFAI